MKQTLQNITRKIIREDYLFLCIEEDSKSIRCKFICYMNLV